MTEMLDGELFECNQCHEMTDTFYQYSDAYYEDDICEDCFNARFGEEEKKGNTEWFLANYDRESLLEGYKKSFLKKIGLIETEEVE